MAMVIVMVIAIAMAIAMAMAMVTYIDFGSVHMHHCDLMFRRLAHDSVVMEKLPFIWQSTCHLVHRRETCGRRGRCETMNAETGWNTRYLDIFLTSLISQYMCLVYFVCHCTLCIRECVYARVCMYVCVCMHVCMCVVCV